MILVEMEPSTSHLFVFWNVKKVSKEKTIHSSSSIPFNQKPQKKNKNKKKAFEVNFPIVLRSHQRNDAQ